MDPATIERELTCKLVNTWHLSVPEHRAIPGRVRGSLIYEAIETALESQGRFPVDWQLDDSFSRGLIERRDDGSYRVTWKADVAMMHYEAVSVQEFESRREAVSTFAKVFFGADIDGIPIDWSS